MGVGMLTKWISTVAVVIFTSQFTFAATSIATTLSPRTPDPEYTSGELCSEQDADFAGYRYEQKIVYCERNVTTEMKNEIYEYYRVPVAQRHNYTIDHFIPLSIGGNNNYKNLWPEHKKIKQTRLNLEQVLYEAVRDNRMSQEEAIHKIIEAKMNPPLSLEPVYIPFKGMN